MRIKNFIKKYFTLIIASMFFPISIVDIFIEAKVYASSEKVNTPGCKCEIQPCSNTTYPGGMVPCEKEEYYEIDKCVCETNDTFTGDPYDVATGIWEICKGKRTGTGCICNIPCEESDCNPRCVNKCKIKTYRMYCKKEWKDNDTRYKCLYCYYEGDEGEGQSCNYDNCQ